MFYKNARIYCSDFKFHHGCFEVDGDRFGEILPDTTLEDAIDLGGATVIPGLIDVHTHGNSGADFSDGDYAGLVKMAAYLAKCGVTSFAPASMTLPYNSLAKAFENAKRFSEECGENISVLRGIHMEGPYLSKSKCGAQNPNFLKKPDFDEFKKLYDISGGLLKIVDIAPELDSADEFIAKAKDICKIGIAHTDADYTCAKSAF
ncbi:MAG: amidohydrolase family protein, partial [Clostridia bacterium]|nr:amidohydrolase family protein [Clostridia bacterium]